MNLIIQKANVLTFKVKACVTCNAHIRRYMYIYIYIDSFTWHILMNVILMDESNLGYRKRMNN